MIAEIVASSRLDVDELSGLGLRRHGPQGRPELLAVGDSGFRVLTSPIHSGAARRSSSLKDATQRFTDGASSQWEAVTADGAGRVFVLQEHPGHLFVLSPTLDRLDAALELQVPRHGGAWQRHWHAHENARGEALLLMRGGHLLVIKQKEPVTLIEFGPSGDAPLELGDDPFLRAGDAFALPPGPVSPLRAWALDAPIESISDASHVGDRVFLLSAKSRCIARLGPLGAHGEPVAIDGPPWALPDRIAQPEGLVVLDEATTPIVASDLGEAEQGDNLFRLEGLGRHD